ncbi:MAG: PLDc N-terminal domain-containing protein [Nocardioidaceae bacterium]|jgi:hypothetical protein
MENFGFWDLIVSMFWFMLLFAWIALVVSIFSDIFRDRELGGVAKALWTLFLIFVPWLGALTYLIVRGRAMNERSAQAAQERDESLRKFVREAAGTTSGTADELDKLVRLRDDGVITASDYEQAKAKVLAA